tara:strand:- start:418 stop:1008 length:591 start_codon:yes stop_codon:yes gene_type:complete
MELYTYYNFFFNILHIKNMHKELIICFAASYFTLKTLASLIVMPILKSKKDINKLTSDSKKHYNTVKKDRTLKGCISIVVGFLLGILLIFVLKPHLRTNKLMCICIILFVTFFSMQIMYELLWQNRFIFEYNNISSVKIKENSGIMEDIKIYAKLYKNSRFAMNVIEVSSISISLLLVFILYYKLKNKNISKNGQF